MSACPEYPDDVAQRHGRSTKLERRVTEVVREMSPPAAGHLDRAVLAMRLAEAAERLARVEVAAARGSGATWQEVGYAFGTNRQAAHERFREGPDGGRSRLSRRPRAGQSRSDKPAL